MANFLKLKDITSDKNILYKYFEYIFIPVLILIYLFATECGIRRTNDSLYYLAAAKSFASSFEFMGPDNEPYILWPPLYPIILSFFQPDPHGFLRVFNLICLIASLFVWNKIGQKYLPLGWGKFYFLLMTISTPFIMVHLFVWSEPFFLILSGVYILVFQKFMEEGKTKMILYAIPFGFLMVLQRTTGLFIITGFFIGLLLFDRRLLLKNIWAILIHGILVISGWCGWLIYNFYIRGEQEAVFFFSNTPRNPENAKIYFSSIATYFLPLQIPGAVYLVWIGLGILFILFSLHFKLPVFHKVMWIVFLLYMSSLLTMHFNDAHRYPVIIMPFFLLSVIFQVYKLKGKLGKVGEKILIAGLGLWFIYPVVRIIYHTFHWHEINCMN
ncbi:hypothetical protein [Flexithrix dorotheae]|uniref:hypothetical protein n=1 Tax=Flexithrix dorotheae TaxID=70993 RepID=UPI00035E88B8|nr:hypothetical protein [Flexithrix dorotheae]